MNAETTALEIHVLGVNGIGLESGNGSITAGRDIPWLQDVAAEDVWTQWQVTYRDVVIVGPQSTKVGVYNLTLHDLADPTNYAELRQLLLDAANAP
ncbi:MAG: hypothetical protein KC776_02830 [Myxococcales bacterium]|nr:hypothetical protein [Myxococcales bacterium]MCB9577913.1 hypothetical protein [Polyangiaceae bacterium]